MLRHRRHFVLGLFGCGVGQDPGSALGSGIGGSVRGRVGADRHVYAPYAGRGREVGLVEQLLGDEDQGFFCLVGRRPATRTGFFGLARRAR